MKIDKKNLITGTSKLMRKKDVISYKSEPKLAKKILHWRAKTTFKQIINKMLKGQLY